MLRHLELHQSHKLMLGLLAAAATLGGVAQADVVLDDFSSGVAAVNHPEGAGQFGVWYDATNSTYGSASASSLSGDPAMVVIDGGYGNGVYVIYEGVVPADGEYSLKIDMKVNESGSPTGFSSYQVGVAVGADAQHRGLNPSALPGLTIVGDYSGLTSGDDSANPVETVTTPTFTASAGENVLIALGTDVVSGGWSSGSSLWSGNTVAVDNIVLVEEGAPPPPPPVDAVVIEDFESGVLAVNSPGTSGQYSVWYDVTSSTWGTPSASALDGSAAMRISDGGYANGVYAIYEGVIPADGTYTVEALIDVVESGGVNGIRGYQIGVAVGADAQHRDSVLPAAPISGTYIGLTPNDDTANPTQTVVTSEFIAQEGDDVLIALCTDVESGGWNGNSALWSGSYVLVDEIVLRGIEVEPPPFELILDNDDGPAVYASTGFSTSGSTGYDGGTYQYAGTGNESTTATWTGTIPEDGYYEISAVYRSGSNRASVATYEITTVDGTMASFLDQRANNLAWALLGDYQLSAGEITITLNAETSEPFDPGTVVIADAVRIRELDGAPPIQDPEMRVANLLVYDSLDDVGTIQSYITDIARKRYNAVAVHARYRGDATYFPNKVDATFPNNEPRNPLVGDVDVLEEVVTRGHAAGLKVFAYVNTMLVTQGTDTDPRPNHVLNQHPDWATWEYNNGDPMPHTTATEVDGIWLDPALTEVQFYHANICADIVMNYDVDGIVIDRQRYPDTRYNRLEADYGYHPEAVAMFNAQTGAEGLPDPFDEDWWQFRRDANTRAIQRIYSTITGIDPDVLLMAYPIGRYTDAHDFNYQDWAAWLENQVMDIVIAQIYTSSNAEFSARAAEHKNAYDGDRFLGISIDVFRPGTDLVGQVEITDILGFQGTAMFSHADMGPLGYFELLAEAWPGIAAWPETPWKADEIQCDGLDIIGTEIDDILIGTACDELIVGWIGNDEMIASGGDDMLVPDATQSDIALYPELCGNRDDIVDGGDGIDTVDYSTLEEGYLLVDLAAGIASRTNGGGGIGTDVVIGIENIIGSEGGHDEYVGNDDANMIWANGLNPSNPEIAGDYVDGAGGDDFITLGGAGVGGENAELLGGAGDDEIHGSDGNNQTIYGEEGNDTIYGYGGKDNICGGPGDDTIDCGAAVENDGVIFSGNAADYEVVEYANGTVVVTDLQGTDGTDTIINVDRLIFQDIKVKRHQFAKKLPNYTLITD